MAVSMKTMMSRQVSGRPAARPAAPMRAVRTVRAQAMDSNNKEYRQTEAAPSLAGLPTLNTTPFDEWKFAPIREATVRTQNLPLLTFCILKIDHFPALS